MQVSYQDFQNENQQLNSNQGARTRIGFFALKNDGDEAIVRIMHDSVDDFDIMYVHNATINGKMRKVNCIRNAYDELDKCPFCAAGKPINKRLYIHLIEYTKDQEGKIVATPKIWERSSEYINRLKNLCQEYAPLSDNIFKIKRNGVAGSVDTTYDIMFANPNLYRSDIYIKDNNLFNNIKALGTAVFDKSYDELAKLLGDNVPTNQTSAPAINRPVVNEVQPASNAAMPNTFTNNYTNMNETSMFNRPKRLYSNE